jgi:hypothetical protein
MLDTQTGKLAGTTGGGSFSELESVYERLPAAFALKNEELWLLEAALAYLGSAGGQQCVPVRQRFSAIQALGAAIAQFPTVREIETAEGEILDRESLIDSLGAFAPSARPLHLPSRIMGARSYLVAKCHAFSMLSRLVQQDPPLFQAARRIIFAIISTLLAEDVYFSCLEDAKFPLEMKYELADDLMALWNTGSDPRTVEHLPALEALWLARDGTPPNFGSMTGASELIRVSMDLGNDWKEFLVSQLGDEETLAALEEFLFGLSWEEIREVRTRLEKFGIYAVDHNEIRFYLGSDPAYTTVNSRDPRGIYDFYIDRREMAARRRLLAVPGPHRTLEEMYLRFRITG